MTNLDTVYIKHDKFNCTKLLAIYVSVSGNMCNYVAS